MEVYDYRQELIDLLNNTADDPQSLLQTQRSLTTILNILNHYQESKPVKQNAPRFVQRKIQSSNELPPQARKTLKSLLTGPANDEEKSTSIVGPVASSSVEAPKEITEEERLAADNRYLVHRKLSGAEINHRYYPEAILHALPFPVEDGDIAQLDYEQKVRGLPVIRRITGDHLSDYTPEKVNVIEYGELKRVPGSDVLQLSKTIKGNSIVDEAPENTIVIDPFKYPGRDIKPGMVIDFAYYDRGNGLTDAKDGAIRWIHEKQDYDTTKQPAKPKVVKKPANPRHDYEKKLDYDLHQRKVLVITGIRSKVKGLKPVIDKHHGLFRGLDASAEEKVSSSKLKREIRDADFVIVCIDAIHHRISQLANHHAKRYEKPLAIANVTSNTAVERAIARALNGDPAYAESSEDLKNYK
ncbi:DUF2325 domain-containing protein [Limosilactobacillus reuteri]|uniref:DUF2325 domain-containing protein n=1 Tax=Limosilactobacillus reuteri TaxID=1598 RepID=A0A517D7P8_LIMRT|nr:DUF2325 domain-containing protein [Limosilactobacillus reuteri]MCC4357597.1 DUF2325 domain-containing protein [Limosilactobacillus reuteri]MCC4363396.1 DUF2325 domain-containing protein [Limosilactobacillus reuteri]MCC4363787.1 DUF2325 domain-containing protein [Limosilactobacillus reuteri]MCC4501620.1 DUF2325 domain-containing protein [Limosilactobacillus reuteri]MRG74971.1 DUF2325 domain-containing protein [Limosilactobacillus reuteri]